MNIKLRFPSLLARLQPGLVAFPALALGFILLSFSFVINIGIVKARFVASEGEIIKEIGYSSAFNWSIVLSLLLPAALLYLCKTYGAFSLVIRNLAEKKMVLYKDYHSVTPETLQTLWEETLQKYSAFLLILFVVGILFSIWECYEYSCHALIINDPQLSDEWDWGIGVLFDPNGFIRKASLIDRSLNILFNITVFLGQGIIIGVVATYVYQAIMVSVFFNDISKEDSSLLLIPDTKSNDKRRGFETLSDYLEQSFIFIGLIYVIFYLSRLQNIYLRSDATGILDFIKTDMIIGFVKDPLNLGAQIQIVKKGLELPSNVMDFSSIMVSLGAFALLIISAFMVGSIARESARKSKNFLLKKLDTEPENVATALSLSTEEIKGSLKDMVFWPINYIRARQFYGLIFLGVFCTFYYKFGLILLGFLFLRIFYDVAKYIFGDVE